MDIIDIILASALSPQGQVTTYAAKAAKAAQDATTAASQASSAVSNIDSITQQTVSNNELAAETIAALQEALDELENSGVNIEAVDAEVKKLTHDIITSTASNYILKTLTTNYPDNTTDDDEVIKLYTSAGQNTDGTMTQKAISDAISAGGGSSSIHFDIDQEGHILIVDDNGNINPSMVSIDDLIEALMKTDSYHLKDAFGVEIDYTEKTFTRSNKAEIPSSAADFNNYSFLGGRMRCNVADDGTIRAFYGDASYRDDGSNGQVMVYQPKFYYQRGIVSSHEIANQGTAIDKEFLILSDKKQNNQFKLHPIFINEAGDEVEYVLLPAYEGSLYDASEDNYDRNGGATIDYNFDKLCSVATSKPIAGISGANLTIINAEQLARNRGYGWHITNMAAENVTQMLITAEFGTMNGQTAIERGIVDLSNIPGKNCSSITGSTSGLGNATGAAAETVNEISGAFTPYEIEGKRAISYRGVENPWGNLWTFVGGVCAVGDGNNLGGQIYMAKGYDYTISASDTTNYNAIPLNLPNSSGWIYRFGYCGPDYDWLYMPIECSSTNANSALPVGDKILVNSALNGIQTCILGGTAAAQENGGAFYYSFADIAIDSDGHATGANLMFIPPINSNYEANIAKWRTKMGV